ncbi:hypothetical protein BGZ63DRAFT_398702 [Mariannaea sp. PMI_226]|nr:hypothetical protein BGZ63DRAFT_398702 [Mariannaea sp. PMI_226]
MAVIKMNTLTRALACALAFASNAVSAAEDASNSDCSSTLPIVTQAAGSTTSDGTVLVTWSICTTVHETHCEGVTSTGEGPPRSLSGSVSVPGQGPPSSYGGDGGEFSTSYGQNEGSQFVTVVNTAASGTQPGYSDPVTSVTGQGSLPNVPPVETPTAITDVASSATDHTEATGYQSGSASYSHVETNPAGTGSEAYTSGPSGATGTPPPPTTTATGAASMCKALPAAFFGVAGMAVALII